jgi:hypothetical protein
MQQACEGFRKKWKNRHQNAATGGKGRNKYFQIVGYLKVIRPGFQSKIAEFRVSIVDT